MFLTIPASNVSSFFLISVRSVSDNDVGLSTFTCKETEEPYSISTVSLFDGLEDRSYYVVGTVFMSEKEVEPSKGRLMIFDVAPKNLPVAPSSGGSTTGGLGTGTGVGSRGSWLLTSEEVGGCVYAIASTEGLLIVAVNSAVSGL